MKVAVSGKGGTGKTTIARLLAQEVADEFFTQEVDAGALTVAQLRETYGLPRHGNPRRPLDDLFFILLSNKTTPRSAKPAFQW